MSSSIFALSGLINGIVALSFGILIIYKNWRDKINQMFFLMTLAIALWSFSYWQWLLSIDAKSALLWVRLLSIGSTLIPIFYFHWIAIFLGISKKRKLLIKLIYIISLLLLIFSFSELFIAGVNPKLSFPYWPEPGILYHFYLAFVYFELVIYSLFLLFKAYQSSDNNEKKGQIFYAILGALFGFGGGVTNFFLWYNIPIVPYGNFLVFLFPFFFGYSMIRYKMFNVKVITTELLTFAIWVFLLVRTLIAPSFQEKIIDGSLLTLVVFFGILLIRAVIKEVEQREKLEKLAIDLEIANERLKQLDEAKSEFLSIASHQLRTPMTSIKGILSMLLEEFWGPLNADQKKYLLQVSQSGERLLSLIEELLDISKIEAGKIKFDFQPVNLFALTEKIIKNMEPQAKDKKLLLDLIQPPAPLPDVLCDSTKIEQVIENLIDNSIKYSTEGGSIIELKKQDVFVIFSIKDNGMGIPKEQLSQLFTKFQRGQMATNQHTEGAGLGLYWADKVIQSHNGKIWAESDGEGKGSAFYFTLPIA